MCVEAMFGSRLSTATLLCPTLGAWSPPGQGNPGESKVLTNQNQTRERGWGGCCEQAGRVRSQVRWEWAGDGHVGGLDDSSPPAGVKLEDGDCGGGDPSAERVGSS